MTALLWLNMILATFSVIIYTFMVLAGIISDSKKQIKKDWGVYLVFLLPIIVSAMSVFISIYFIFFEL